ncbi:MAG: hypothetical protein ACRED1_11305 [Limisphaerales bacterium]
MRKFLLTPQDSSNWASWSHTPLWYYQHDKIKDLHISSVEKEEVIRNISNGINEMRSELIPYKPGDDPVYDTNQP